MLRHFHTYFLLPDPNSVVCNLSSVCSRFQLSLLVSKPSCTFSGVDPPVEKPVDSILVHAWKCIWRCVGWWPLWLLFFSLLLPQLPLLPAPSNLFTPQGVPLCPLSPCTLRSEDISLVPVLFSFWQFSVTHSCVVAPNIWPYLATSGQIIRKCPYLLLLLLSLFMFHLFLLTLAGDILFVFCFVVCCTFLKVLLALCWTLLAWKIFFDSDSYF